MSKLFPAGWVFRGAVGALALAVGSLSLSCVQYGNLPEPRGAGSIPRSEAESAVRRLEIEAAEIASSCVVPIAAALGIARPSLDGIALEVTTGGLTDADEGAATTSGSGRHVTIELRAEAFLSGSRDLAMTVCHELVHALMRRHMSSGDYGDVPKWAREGLAVTLAGQTNEKLYRQIFEHPVAPENEILGLAAAERRANLDQYFEYALAFTLLGPGIATRLMSGENVYRAILAETGLSRERFHATARDHARGAMRVLRERFPDALKRAIALERERGMIVAVDLYAEAVRESGLQIDETDGISGELWPAGVYSARKWAEGARYTPALRAKAAAVYRRLLSAGMPKHYYGSDVAAVRYEYAGLLGDLGRFEESLRNYFMVIQLHFEAPLLSDAAGVGVARTYFAMGDAAAEEALRWLGAYRDNGTHVDLEVEYMRAITQFRLCRRSRAEKMLERLVRGADGRVAGWRARAQDALEAIQGGAMAAPVTCR